MIKIIGIILIVISGTLIGFIISHRNFLHIKFLEEYIALILDFKTEIKYIQTPLSEIIKNYNSKKYLSPILKNCINLMKNYDFEKSWKKSFSNLFEKFGVTTEEEDIITNFGSKLGASDTENQIDYCNYNLSVIKPYLEKAIKNKSRNQKLPIILGLCISLILSIVII